MSYMKAAFKHRIYDLSEKTGYDSEFLMEEFWKLNDERGIGLDRFCEIGSLAMETGYDFMELVEIYRQVNDEMEEAGDTFNWEYFCGVTRELDW